MTLKKIMFWRKDYDPNDMINVAGIESSDKEQVIQFFKNGDKINHYKRICDLQN